jgi:hypothetical protein
MQHRFPADTSNASARYESGTKVVQMVQKWYKSGTNGTKVVQKWYKFVQEWYTWESGTEVVQKWYKSGTNGTKVVQMVNIEIINKISELPWVAWTEYIYGR